MRPCTGCHRQRVEPDVPSNRAPGSSKAWKRISRAHEPCMHSLQLIGVTLEEVTRSLRAGSARLMLRQIAQILLWGRVGTHTHAKNAEGHKKQETQKNGVPSFFCGVRRGGSTSRSIETGEVFQQQAGLSIHPAACLLAVLGDAVKTCTGEPRSPRARRPFAWHVDPDLQCVAPLLFSGTCRIMFCKKLKVFFFHA